MHVPSQMQALLCQLLGLAYAIQVADVPVPLRKTQISRSQINPNGIASVA